jgi:hypothetical protein
MLYDSRPRKVTYNSLSVVIFQAVLEENYAARRIWQTIDPGHVETNIHSVESTAISIEFVKL